MWNVKRFYIGQEVTGDKKYPITMDQQAGDILRRRRYKNLKTAPVPLGNGIVNPAAQQLSALDIDARIDWLLAA